MLEINCPICGRKCECIDVDCDTPNTLKEISVLYLFECQSCAEPFGITANYELKNATMNYSKRVEVEEPFDIEVKDEIESAVNEILVKTSKEDNDKIEAAVKRINTNLTKDFSDFEEKLNEIFKPLKFVHNDNLESPIIVTKADSFGKLDEIDKMIMDEFLDAIFKKNESASKSAPTKVETVSEVPKSSNVDCWDDYWEKPRKSSGHPSR